MQTLRNRTGASKGKKAVVLLSGGLDSAVTLAWAIKEGYVCDALTFVYGQRHEREVRSAKAVAEKLGAVKHSVVKLDPTLFEGSALTGPADIPLDRSVEEISTDIPATYVPARNTVFLASALAYAENAGAFDIFIGANVIDYSGYPDCRPEFIKAFEKLANLATKASVSGKGRFVVHAPLIDMTKAQIVKLAFQLGVDLSSTWSCYNPGPDQQPCMRCDSCLIRQRAIEEVDAETKAKEEDKKQT